MPNHEWVLSGFTRNERKASVKALDELEEGEAYVVKRTFQKVNYPTSEK
jgi:hypothetical protein